MFHDGDQLPRRPAHANREAQWGANLEEEVGIVAPDSTILRQPAEILARTRTLLWVRPTTIRRQGCHLPGDVGIHQETRASLPGCRSGICMQMPSVPQRASTLGYRVGGDAAGQVRRDDVIAAHRREPTRWVPQAHAVSVRPGLPRRSRALLRGEPGDVVAWGDDGETPLRHGTRTNPSMSRRAVR